MSSMGPDLNSAEMGSSSDYPSIASSSHAKKGSNVEILVFDGPNDARCPYNWSETRKWLVASIALLGTLTLPLNGTSITVAADEINAQFGVSDTATFTNSYWSVTSWTLGGAVFIIIGLPLMEDIGVRLGYLISYICFFLMVIPQAVAENYATLVVTRFFTGGFVAMLANTIASMIPDMWESDAARSLPVSLYILCFLVASTLGPPLFAGVVQYTNWRWIFYIQLILYGALFPLFLYFIKETRHHIILRQHAKAIRKATGKPIYSAEEIESPPLSARMYEAVTRPGKLLSTEPVLICCTLWSAFAFGTVFFFTQSVEQVFQGLYGWSEYQCGYVQGAVVIGEILGWIASLCGSRLFLQSANRNTEMPGTPIPEARLYVSVFGSFVGVTGGMFVYAWTSYSHIHWIAPSIGLGMVGFGIMTVMSAVADYVTDAYADSGKAGSAISAVAAGESIVAGLLPLATQSMYTTLGFNWASTLLGLIALVISFAPVVFIWKGRQLRERSEFMKSAGKSGLGKSHATKE